MLAALFLLFTSAFVSASLLPGASEAVYLAMLYEHRGWALPLFAAASAGNAFGAMTSYILGRFLPAKRPEVLPRLLNRYGIWALLLSWLPIVGDALPLAAGWLRYHWAGSLALIAAGKAARYGVLYLGFSAAFPA